jgi:membrane dipeptidase
VSPQRGSLLTPEQLRRAEHLHAEACVIDATCPLVNPKEIKKRLPELRRGGVTCAVSTVASIEGAYTALHEVAAWYPKFREWGGDLCLATTAADIDAAKRSGRVAVVMQFQGGTPLEYNANLVEAFYRMGIRVIQLTYNARNPLGDGCTERTDVGLSDLGLEVIAEMNRLGLLVDLSHVGYRTSMEAIEASQAPVVFSHSNAKAVCDSPRNLADDQIRAVSARGGVVGVVAFPAFVSKHPSPTVEHLLDHIDYLVSLAGDDHVGLGFDFSTETEDDYEYFKYRTDVYPKPPWVYPAGIDGFEKIPNVTRGLVARGYTDDAIRKILGGNFLRVFRQVWGG